jgi:2-amino-4-hydroxy-6-hydroxymethyldihydropteridine pyrophosphokinase
VVTNAAIAVGSNLAAQDVGGPIAVVEAAVAALEDAGVRIVRRSRWYWSEPVPPAAQPLFVNGVVLVAAEMLPVDLLRQMLAIEQRFGRIRTAINQSRTLDLDLVAFGERVVRCIEPSLIVPHPRLHLRAFVLQPLDDVWPQWRHPVTGLSPRQLRSGLAGDQWLQPIAH